MKKALLALLAGLAFTATTALAADLPQPSTPAPYYKAPAPAAATWTGCYVGGGAGYGVNNVDSYEVNSATGAFENQQGSSGGRGWLGQAQVGCDYQFPLGGMGNWVVGAFADYDFMDLRANHLGAPDTTTIGTLKENSAWSAGGRIGFLVTPTLLAYESAGYTETHFDQTNYSNYISGAPAGVALSAATFDGWFLGGGFEYAITFLPINGLFLKTEYRFSQYESKTVPDLVAATGAPSGTSEVMHPYTQTITTELVYRFNWQ